MAFPNSTLQMMILQLAISLFLCSRDGHADTNGFVGSFCSSLAVAENSLWAANLNSVLSSLEAKVATNNGFYKAEAGESSDKIYGLIQCRGDVSPSHCQECTRESFALAAEKCDGSTSVAIWQDWCYLHYSNASFFGVWEGSGSASSTGLDDADVAAKGMAMMTGLAAAAPNETLMFGKSEMDDGKGGKRYGLAQCSGDLEKLACLDCLESSLKGFFSTIANKRRWRINVIGCFMMYDDSRFYFNTTTVSAQSPVPSDTPITQSRQSPTSAPGMVRPQNDANRAWAGRLPFGVAIFAIVMAYLLDLRL